MSSSGMRVPLVVGIDGAGSAGDGVEWAAAEAAARRCPLHVVHAFHPPLPADPYGLVSMMDGIDIARAEAERVLAEALDCARSVAPDIDVSTRVLHGTAARALLDESRYARLLVLCGSGPHGRRGLWTRPVAAQVAAHAACPVVVIQPPNSAGEAGWSPPRVVVGIDAADSCASAVGFAFQAARQRGVPLFALHAWRPDLPADLEAVAAPASMAEALARGTLERALYRWHPEFTDVPVHTALVRGDAERALIAQSRGAALLVVGTRGRGHILGTVLGSVSQAVLHQACSPLAIIRYDHLPTGPSPAVPGRGRKLGSGTRHRIVPRFRRWPA
jgi:nucleotide-binding universal stress UspA family protein